jgi:hypothetical protein
MKVVPFEYRFNNRIHQTMRRDKGAVVMYRDRLAFLSPGDTFTDHEGRKYLVAEDGSMRRVKE